MVLVALAIATGAAAGTARAQSRLNRTMKLAPGGRFVLDTFAGSVSVTGGNETGADVVVTRNNDDVQHDIDFNFEENPGDAEVRARWHGPWSIFGMPFIGLHLHYDVRVPKNTRVEIRTSGGEIQVFALAGDAELRTSGGRIEASQINGNMRAVSSGGTISAEGIHGNADLATSGGGIDAKAIDGSLSAHTSGGWIRLNGVGGRVDAHTSGGWIAATFNKGDSQGGQMDTSGGWITAKIDAAANLEIDASTSGGGVRSDLPLRVTGSMSRDHLRGTLGSGGATLRMHTSGGAIRISGL